ncbi:protein of unknown function [Clostridium beijerinckii]|nr:protein of unknown function [Clostridium beijerinckii]
MQILKQENNLRGNLFLLDLFFIDNNDFIYIQRKICRIALHKINRMYWCWSLMADYYSY